MERSERDAQVVRVTLEHILGILATASNGSQEAAPGVGETIRGIHFGITKKADAIVEQVLEKL